MEETNKDAKDTAQVADVNFISSMVAHRVIDTQKLESKSKVTEESKSTEEAQPKEANESEPEKKDNTEVKTTNNTQAESNTSSKAKEKETESKVSDVNFISSMVSHRVVDPKSLVEPSKQESEPIKEEKKSEPIKHEKEVVAIKQEEKKAENLPEAKPTKEEVQQNKVDDFNFISSMVAHRVIDPKALIQPTKVDKASDANNHEQIKTEGSQKAKTIEGEIKQNQRNPDKEARNVTSGETPKKAKSKDPKQVSAETLAALEKSWDVSQDIELCKVLNKARLLAAAKPAPPPQQKQPPKFNISLEKLRRLPNPTSRIEALRATLHRNLAAFPVKDLSSSQKVEIEKLIVKIMGVAYMPEDITGWYEFMSKKDQRAQMKTFDKQVFYNSGDIRYREAPVDEWKQGSGLYINNYENLIIKTNVRDQLKLTSAEEGHDIRSVVIRLKRAVGLIEEAIRSVTGKGFQHKGDSFVHSNEHLHAHGFDLSFIVCYPGFFHEEEKLIKNTGIQLGLNVQKYGKRDGVYELTVSQKPDDSIEAILQRAIKGVDSLAAEEELLQKKHNIKFDELH